jgi:hypothetical protein
LVVVLSDFLDPAGTQRILSPLVERGCEVHAIQILAPEEIQPPLTGDLRLLDSERGEFVEITVTPKLLQRYRDILRAATTSFEADCRRRGIGYLLISSADPVDTIVLRTLRRSGLVL